MIEDIWLQEGFRKPEPMAIDPHYYICGGRYTYDEINSMSLQELYMRRIGNIPNKLYKYFPNKIIDGRNYSVEALENNTVYLQEIKKFDDSYDCTLSIKEEEFARIRIEHYANICGMQVDEEWDYNKCAHEFSIFLFNKIHAGIELEQIFGVDQLLTRQDYRRSIFCLKLKKYLLEYSDQEDVWCAAFYEAIHNEYLDMIEVVNRFRVACFTTSPYMINMWSNQYADNNQGFCIEYEMPALMHRNDDLSSNLFPVIYSDARTDVLNKCLAVLDNEMDEEYLGSIYKFGVLAKSKSIWMGQDEWRLVSCDNMLADDYNCKFYPITKVYLGEKMPKDQRRTIIDICNRKGIPYAGVIRNNERYQMIECTKLCEECEKMR